MGVSTVLKCKKNYPGDTPKNSECAPKYIMQLSYTWFIIQVQANLGTLGQTPTNFRRSSAELFFNEQLAIASKFTSIRSKLELAGYSVNISMPNTDNSHPQLFLKLKLFSSFEVCYYTERARVWTVIKSQLIVERDHFMPYLHILP